MTRALVIAFALAILGLPASAAEPEHWACSDMGFQPPAVSHWTIVEGRMFARNGKGYYTVVHNTPTTLMAYLVVSKPRQPFVSVFYVIDKAGGSFVSYDDLLASSTVHYKDDVEPAIRKGPCIRE